MPYEQRHEEARVRAAVAMLGLADHGADQRFRGVVVDVEANEADKAARAPFDDAEEEVGALVELLDVVSDVALLQLARIEVEDMHLVHVRKQARSAIGGVLTLDLGELAVVLKPDLLPLDRLCV